VSDPLFCFRTVDFGYFCRYAPNLLVYPHGDWYGTLEPANSPSILHHILTTKPYTLTHSPYPPKMHTIPYWRGRMGLSSDDQKELAAKVIARASQDDENDNEKKGDSFSDAVALGVFGAISTFLD